MAMPVASDPMIRGRACDMSVVRGKEQGPVGSSMDDTEPDSQTFGIAPEFETARTI
ncbi:hypothetical protein [Nocardia sp. NPDC059239]|uniref:hypothetical protein n=1 Tax=unclassified Nocardia TaxID=2637762 RepID=UPI0036838DD3